MVGNLHFSFIFLFLWSVRVDPLVDPKLTRLASLFTLLLVEMGMIFSFFPFSVWNIALFIMTILYIGLGLRQSHIQERLFQNTLTEYSGVAIFLGMLFFFLLPWK
jgi:hypothetical protein